MAKTTSAKEYRKKKSDELLADLKKLREELQKIRFTKSSGTAVSKLSKIKDLRKQIARVLTIIRENKKYLLNQDMAKTVSAKEYRKKNTADLLAELKKLREELQKIRFTKGSGTAVSKLSKIKDLRKQIARILTIIRQNRKEEVVKGLRERVTKKEEGKEGKEEEVKTTIKNLKMKHIPLDMRPKLTRAMRRRMTKFERKLVTLRQLKRKLNFPMRKFAVPNKA